MLIKKIKISNKIILAFGLLTLLGIGLSNRGVLQSASSYCGSLVLLNHFDGNANDDSGLNNNGAVNGADCNASGKFGNACGFDGIDDYIVVNNNLGFSSSYSASFWMKPGITYDTSNSQNKYFLTSPGNSNANQGAISVSIYNNDPGKIRFGFYDGSSYPGVLTAQNSWSANTWYHITAVFDDAANTMTIYVNGVQSNQATVTTSPGQPNNKLYIGALSDNTRNFNGTIDELAIFNKALTASEAAALYSDGSPISCVSSPPPAAQCGDGIDNDGDSLIDYPADSGCFGASDGDETNAVSSPAQPAPVILWQNSPGHSTTRPHNRKLIYDPATKNYFAFFGVGTSDPDGIIGFNGTNGILRMRWKSSSDGVNWTNGGQAYYQGTGNSSASDALLDGNKIVYLYLKYIPGGMSSYRIKSFNISGNNLIDSGIDVALSNFNLATTVDDIVFYGSITKDTSGYYWVAAMRETQAKPVNQTPLVFKSNNPNDLSSWSGAVTIAPIKSKVESAPDIIALDQGRVIVVMKVQDTSGFANLPNNEIRVKLYDPSKGGWQADYQLFSSTELGNAIRPAAEFDTASKELHLVYGDAQSNLRHMTLKYPYGQADWSAKPGALIASGLTPAPAENDVSMEIDLNTTPASMYAIYVKGGYYKIQHYDGPSGQWWPNEKTFGAQTGGSATTEGTMLKDYQGKIAALYMTYYVSDPNKGDVVFQEYTTHVTPPPNPGDTVAPSAPANLTATAISTSQINLSWSASTDNIGVIGYKIYRNGSLLTTQNNQLTVYSDTGLTANTAYTYKVSAIDAAGNESAQSTQAIATTQAGQLSSNNILQSSDLQYLGVFAPPAISGTYERYGRGMNRCKYVSSNLCNFTTGSDPSPNDGFPGCLMCNSHPDTDLIGAFEIKPPVVVNPSNRTSSYWSNSLPHGQQVLPFMDCTGGILAQYSGGSSLWDIASALILPNGDGICQFYDWYNTGENDNPSAVWFTPNSAAPNIQGPYNWGPMNDSVFHANKNAANLGLIPKAFSDAYLNGNGHQYCYSGYNRGGSGGQESSPGPTLYAFDCESRPSVVQPGPLTATPLLYYNAVMKSYDNIPLMPEHTPRDTCDDLSWINYNGKRGVLASCIKGGPYWWYGKADPTTDPAAHRNHCLWNAGNPVGDNESQNPGVSCMTEFLSWGPSLSGIVEIGSDKGYHAIFKSHPYYRARLVFYDEDELIEVAQGIRQPTNVSRSIVLDNPSELWSIDGTASYQYGGLAFDDTNGLIYIVQEDGVKDNPVVHVYKINPGANPPAVCVYNYTPWSACQSNNTQTRTVTSFSPAGCSGAPNLTQSCSYVAPDTTPPAISTPAVSVITNSAAISFTTNENSNSYIQYGLTASYGQQTQTTSNSTNFSITISNLSSNTGYNYRIISTDSLGNTNQSINYAFTTNQATTPDTTPPADIANFSASNITQTSAKLNWTASGDDGQTGIAAGYDIRYSTSPITGASWASAAQVSGEPNPSLSGSEDYVSVGLAPSTTYYFAVKTFDEAGNISGLSNIISFITLDNAITPPNPPNPPNPPVSPGGGTPSNTYTDTTPPSRPANFQAKGADRQIGLTWINPADADFVRVKILRTESNQGEPVCPASHSDPLAKTIYEGSKAEYTDINLDNSKKYCYAIFTYDQTPNYSVLTAQIAKPDANVKAISIDESAKDAVSPCAKYDKIISLIGVSSIETNIIAVCEADSVYSRSQKVELSKEETIVYDKLKNKISQFNGLNTIQKYSIAQFIREGTPTTKKLGAGERAGVINSYYQAFNKLPKTLEYWSDIIKIANGRWPKEMSKAAENKAKIEFKKVYKREAEMSKPNDNAAVSVMAYGLRPAKRNTNSEKAGSKIFKAIYKKSPQTALEWDIVRAIAYSGAKR